MVIFSRGGGDQPAAENAELARRAAGRGGFSNVVALFAQLFSGWSFYETVWKADAIRMFVAPQIQYADPYNGVFDVYEIPITLANTGARSGVVLSFELMVENPKTGETKSYYSAKLGPWRKAFNAEGEPFAPLTVAGREAITRQVLFFPKAGETVDRLVSTDPGSYRFTLTMNAAPVDRLPSSLAPEDQSQEVRFELEIDGVDYRAFNNGGTAEMRTRDYAPVVSE